MHGAEASPGLRLGISGTNSSLYTIARQRLPPEQPSFFTVSRWSRSWPPPMAAADPAPEMDGRSYVEKLGFFCRKEFEWENATGIPLRLRLGSLAACNRLEGKPGW
ncbi:MAG TPA: hypothetical protein VGR89_03600 [Puia sp.]|nr:hypothetical protein [Puia sp.]